MKSVVRQWYKTLLFMGREYPEQSGGYKKFRVVLKKHFQSTPADTEVQFQKAIEKAEYAEKVQIIELEALYFLKRYRHLKRKYYQ
ncbi:hypothetical protein CLIB1423_42S00342 [[Candida] railenensis]|uniref:Uncharacterized protein n=1 Tax=[Candida] railenensis TaxID=45579 RepID=A0A9P0QUQ2_9ASCO|nr:hypothetical protein CLIB1423_42S00342 [[Candida] railenensis]